MPSRPNCKPCPSSRTTPPKPWRDGLRSPPLWAREPIRSPSRGGAKSSAHLTSGGLRRVSATELPAPKHATDGPRSRITRTQVNRLRFGLLLSVSENITAPRPFWSVGSGAVAPRKDPAKREMYSSRTTAPTPPTRSKALERSGERSRRKPLQRQPLASRASCPSSRPAVL